MPTRTKILNLDTREESAIELLETYKEANIDLKCIVHTQARIIKQLREQLNETADVHSS